MSFALGVPQFYFILLEYSTEHPVASLKSIVLIKIHCSGAGSKMLPQTVQSRIGIFCTEARKHCFEMLIYSFGQPITRKSVSGPPSCPTNIPADHKRSQFVTRDGFAL